VALDRIVIVVSIPLAILVSVITLSLLGETLNVMTLGGLALAVGILSTTRRSRSEHEPQPRDGEPVIRAIPTARSRSRPRLRRDALHLHVFVPVVFITGVAKYCSRHSPSGRLRDARELPPLAHRSSRPWCATCSGRGASARPGREQTVTTRPHLGRAPGVSTAASSACGTGMARCWRGRSLIGGS